VHGEEADPVRATCATARSRSRDVVELQIEENVFALPQQLADEIHAGGGVEFHADL